MEKSEREEGIGKREGEREFLRARALFPQRRKRKEDQITEEQTDNLQHKEQNQPTQTPQNWLFGSILYHLTF